MRLEGSWELILVCSRCADSWAEAEEQISSVYRLSPGGWPRELAVTDTSREFLPTSPVEDLGALFPSGQFHLEPNTEVCVCARVCAYIYVSCAFMCACMCAHVCVQVHMFVRMCECVCFFLTAAAANNSQPSVASLSVGLEPADFQAASY